MPAGEAPWPTPRSCAWQAGWRGLLSCLVFWVLPGCNTPGIPGPSLPTTEDQRSDDPSRDAQVRLLAEAHRAFSQGRYSTAVLFFTRYLDRATDSDRLAESRWWLGRAYEELGDVRAAMAQYRLIAVGGLLSSQRDGTVYEAEALRRLDELRQRHAFSAAVARQVAVRVEARENLLNTSERLGEWAAAGVTAVVAGPISLPIADADFRLLESLVKDARRTGLLVYPAIDLHQPGQPVSAEWLGGEGRPDVSNAAYGVWIEAAAARVLESGCDGLFLQARSSPGFADEASAGSLHEFAESFGLEVSPQRLFATAPSEATDGKSPLYWRWVGWKGGEYGKLIGRLARQVRSVRPAGMVLVEMHEVTLHDALQGLLQYGEDVLDASRRAGAVIVVRQEGAATPLKRASGRADDASRLHIEMLPRSAEPFSSEAVRRWLRALPDDDAPVVLFPQHEPSVP